MRSPRPSVWMSLAAAVAASLPAAGCRSPAGYRRQADRAAYRIIAARQQEALGRTEPIAIEPASETLRRMLLLSQDLPRSAEASLGSTDVAPIRQWPDRAYLAGREEPS